MTIYLIRHGKTSDDIVGRYQRSESELDHSANLQLVRLKTFFKNISIDHILCSPLLRTKQTAKILFGNPRMRIVPFIYEYLRPRLLDRAPHQIGVQFWEGQHKIDKYDPDWKFDGGESFNEIKQRVKKFTKLLEKYNSDSRIAVVGHGNFFRHFIGFITLREKYHPAIFFDFLRKIEVNNAGFVVIKLDKKTGSSTIQGIYNEQIQR